jgi:3D (Asp-Asp-Asp) domain-containing protein
VNPTLPTAGPRLAFTATAYCKGKTTASGVDVRTGIAASDPAILPVGSVVNIATGAVKYNGVYTIMDTGPKVQGRILDIYMWSCHEALAFGRQPVEVTVLRLGWNPSASTPSLVDRLFRRREAARRAPPPAAPDSKVGLDAANGAFDGAAFQDTVEPGAEPSQAAPSRAASSRTAPSYTAPSQHQAPSHQAPSHAAPSDAPSHLAPPYLAPAVPDLPAP